VELLQSGAFNEWTEKSLARLAQMMPARYAKPEVSVGFLGASETYVYRTPLSLVPPPPEPAETPSGEPEQTPVAPATADQGVEHARPQ
jgi:hypothetical protein